MGMSKTGVPPREPKHRQFGWKDYGGDGLMIAPHNDRHVAGSGPTLTEPASPDPTWPECTKFVGWPIIDLSIRGLLFGC